MVNPFNAHHDYCRSPGEVYKSAEVTVVTKDDDIKTELHTMVNSMFHCAKA